MSAARQRLDKWLYFTRLVKSRTLAQKIIAAGQVRVNGRRTLAADHPVAPGDVLTMALHTRLVVIRVVAPGARRGPAPEARTLYEEAAPAHSLRAAEPSPPLANRFLRARD